ncbi:MAG: hypothetical protein JRJ12_15065 [Deltaproteobacteria bacterium]|nr:hypothetical protein [Deltaproteobacteria bacterium]MBW2072780.1 hypothetical protein [Deltaproteobacteria bacterium]
MNGLQILDNQRGNALVVALLMLVVLTLLGIAATNTSTIEIQLSSNDKMYKTAFYNADAATEVGSELLEQSIEERDWLDDSDHGNIRVTNGDFYLNQPTDTPDPIPSDGNRDAFLPRTASTTTPHTNLKFRGNPQLSTGSAVQLAAGYEGKGKGAGSGGAWLIYNIRSQYRGLRNSEARINLQWRHVM